MTSELINYLKDEKYLNLAIESITETFELYNYDVPVVKFIILPAPSLCRFELSKGNID